MLEVSDTFGRVFNRPVRRSRRELASGPWRSGEGRIPTARSPSPRCS